MARADVIILLRRLLKRMEQEEWTLDEDLGHDTILTRPGYGKYGSTGLDTYTLKFRGPKRETHIPQVITVWEDGQTMSTAWNDIPARRLNSIEAVYRYCPIKLSTIKPLKLFQEVVIIFELNHVSTIEE